MDPIELTLFVLEGTREGRHAIECASRLCSDHLPTAYQLEVVDAREAIENQDGMAVLATPALHKETPPPAARVIGDLSDGEAVLAELGIPSDPPHDVGDRA